MRQAKTELPAGMTWPVAWRGSGAIPATLRSRMSSWRAGTGRSATTTPAACSWPNSATGAGRCLWPHVCGRHLLDVTVGYGYRPWLAYLLIAAGWVLTTAVIAGVTRTLQKN